MARGNGRSRLFDSSVIQGAEEAVDFVTNLLESSTEYSIIAKDLDGKILLWNEGARRVYGYEASEVVGKANSDILHTPEDVAAGKPGHIKALKDDPDLQAIPLAAISSSGRRSSR